MATIATYVAAFLLSAPALLAQAQAAATLAKEDARLNQAYQRRIAQLRIDPAELSALRGRERDWIVQRDRQCGKDLPCLTQATAMHADYFKVQLTQNNPATKAGDPIPQDIRGKWVIRKVLPTRTISCWGDKESRGLLNTEIEYLAESLRWNTTTVRNLGSTVTTVKAQQFAEENSGGGSGDSQVSFSQLGITASAVKQIAIQHPDVTIKDGPSKGSSEMPGDTVLVKGAGALVFSVCNVYFEADRKPKP